MSYRSDEGLIIIYLFFIIALYAGEVWFLNTHMGASMGESLVLALLLGPGEIAALSIFGADFS